MQQTVNTRNRPRVVFPGGRPLSRLLMALAGLVMSGCAAQADGPQPVLAQNETTQPTVLTESVAVSGQAAPVTSVDSDLLYTLLVAEFALKRGQWPLALEKYAAAARASGDPAVAERAVRIALMARDNEGGLEVARLWARLAKPNYSARQIYAAFLIRVGRFDEATTVLKELSAELAKKDDKIFARIATMLSRVKPPATSIQVMESLVADQQDNVEAQFALAQLLGRFGKQEQAKEVLDRVRKLDPSHERAAIYNAQILMRSDKKIDAADSLAKFIEANPKANSARLSYARVLVELKRHKEARAEFEKLSVELPDSVDITYALGLLLLQSNDPDAAEVQFKKLIKSKQRRPVAWYYLGQIAENRKQLDTAIDAYQRVVRSEPWLNAQLRIAVLLDKQGKLQAARKFLQDIQPGNRQEAIRVQRAEAEILIRNEKLEAALEVYNRALEENSDSSLLYSRAMLAVQLDKLDIVERDLREILNREPDNADALNALGYTLADRTDRYDEAYVLIKRAYELKPNDYYIIDSLGWVLYRLGRNEEALKHLRRAMALKPGPEIAAHLGEVLWVMGGTAEAREVWSTALKGQPDDKRLLEVIKRFDQVL